MVESLSQLGGVATRAQLIKVSSRPAVDRALAAGDVVALSPGRYALASVGVTVAAAHRLTGTVSHASAALHWGWALKTPPPLPDVIVPKNRKVTAEQARGVTIHRVNLSSGDRIDAVTSQERTLCDCLRSLSFDEALCVADSALREGFPRARLLALARDARGPGSGQLRRVASLACAEAANPFESCLRAITLTVPGLEVRPQVSVYDPKFLGRPDLVDERLRIVLEADSFEWHGSRAALRRDARRYNAFVVRGWLVLRFVWEDVMSHPDAVRSVLMAAVAERTEQLCSGCRAA